MPVRFDANLQKMCAQQSLCLALRVQNLSQAFASSFASSFAISFATSFASSFASSLEETQHDCYSVWLQTCTLVSPHAVAQKKLQWRSRHVLPTGAQTQLRAPYACCLATMR